jgi:hypothetical protein
MVEEKAPKAKAKSSRLITWKEAGREIERRRIVLGHLRRSRLWTANCYVKRRRFVEAFGGSALAAVANLLKEIGKIGGRNGRKKNTTVGPDQKRRA